MQHDLCTRSNRIIQSAMKHEKGRTDEFKIHIGGGAFDAGTSEARKQFPYRPLGLKFTRVVYFSFPEKKREFGIGSKLINRYVGFVKISAQNVYFFISGSYVEFEILELTNLQVKGLTLIKQITIVLEFLNVVPNLRFDQSKK